MRTGEDRAVVENDVSSHSLLYLYASNCNGHRYCIRTCLIVMTIDVTFREQEIASPVLMRLRNRLLLGQEMDQR